MKLGRPELGRPGLLAACAALLCVAAPAHIVLGQSGTPPTTPVPEQPAAPAPAQPPEPAAEPALSLAQLFELKVTEPGAEPRSLFTSAVVAGPAGRFVCTVDFSEKMEMGSTDDAGQPMGVEFTCDLTAAEITADFVGYDIHVIDAKPHQAVPDPTSPPSPAAEAQAAQLKGKTFRFNMPLTLAAAMQSRTQEPSDEGAALLLQLVWDVPAEAVGAGARWTVDPTELAKQNMQGRMDSTQGYQIKEIKGDRVLIDYEESVKATEQGGTEVVTKRQKTFTIARGSMLPEALEDTMHLRIHQPAEGSTAEMSINRSVTLRWNRLADAQPAALK